MSKKRVYSPKQFVMFDKREWDEFVKEINRSENVGLNFSDLACPIIETDVEGYPSEITYIKKLDVYTDGIRY